MVKRNLIFGILATLGFGCQPTPDYRVTVHDISRSTAVLLVAWKGDDDAVPKTSLAVPVADLSDDQRDTYMIGLGLAGASEGGGIVSIATVDRNFCITAVVSSDDLSRSSSTSVTQIDIVLDPNQNSGVVQQPVVPSPPISCPPNPPFPAFPPPQTCAKVPGLTMMPSEPTPIPTQPVMLNALRQLRGQAREFNEGKLSFFGWGFDHSVLTFGATCDPSNCFLNLTKQFPQYTGQLLFSNGFGYPTLVPVSYSQLDLSVSQLKSAFKVDPSSGFQDAVILCIAESASSFTLSNPTGGSTSFAEVIPK